MNRWIPWSSALSLCAVLAACNGQSAAETPEAKTHDAPGAMLHRNGQTIEVPQDSPLNQRLEIATVELGEITPTLSAPGVIEAEAEKLVKITPPVAGRVVKLHRSLGDTVKAGEPLFTLDSADISNARSDSSKAQATALQAQHDLDRQKLLFDADIAPRKDLEAAQLALSHAQIDARASSDRLAQLGANSTGAGRRDYVLRSPISGRVVEMTGAQGAYWNDINTPIMTVADLSTVWLTANVTERDIAQVFVGQSAHITLNAFPGQAVEGQVRYIGELLDPETRSTKVRVAIDNRDGRFRPGMFARVGFLGHRQTAITLPASALQQNGLSTRVFVEQSPQHFVSRSITLGAQLGDRYEITSGLKAGERVVVKEGVLLND